MSNFSEFCFANIFAKHFKTAKIHTFCVKVWLATTKSVKQIFLVSGLFCLKLASEISLKKSYLKLVHMSVILGNNFKLIKVSGFWSSVGFKIGAVTCFVFWGVIYHFVDNREICDTGRDFPLYKVWWLREASQIGQMFIPLCEKVVWN